MNEKKTQIEIIRKNKILDQPNKYWSRDIVFKDNSQTLKKYDKYSKIELEKKLYKTSVIFRIFSMRGPFIIGKDFQGQIQIYVSKIDQPEIIDYIAKKIDIGDIVKVDGLLMKTKTNVLSIKANKISIITKSLKPLPEKFHGLKDKEIKYRKRYLDLLINEDSKKIFWKRSRIIQEIRFFFNSLNYLEVDTPILTNILNGAAAKPFITHHNALNMSFYLRIATELPLKKLIVGGFERVYEIGRLFRNEGVDTTHNPEFTTIEFYESLTNCQGMMKRTEDLFLHLANVFKINDILIKNKKISIKPPFQKLNMIDAVNKATNRDFRNISLSEAKKVALSYKIQIKNFYKIGHIINELFETLVEKTIIQPTFVYSHPLEISPLAKEMEDDSRFADRAELFINGREYANMFTELNNPMEQYKRFKQQLQEKKDGNSEASEIDYDFLEALEYGMPPTGGCGIGIDRLIMLFTNKDAIKEVLLFPHLKSKKKFGKKQDVKN